MEPPKPTPAQRKSRLLRRLLLGIVYLTALSGLILWEYREHLELLSSACDTSDPGTSTGFYARTYNWMLDRASSDAATQVAVVAIPANLADIQSNVCLGRQYLSDVLRTLATQQPAVIVVDKFYGPSSCNTFPQATQELLATVHSLTFPIVVGESTDLLPSERHETCLARRPQLDFQAPTVLHGLTRLNVETQNIPLRWPVLPSESSQEEPELKDSLSWTAAQAYDPSLASRPRIHTLLATARPPFARLSMDLPRQTSTQLLCQAGTPGAQKRWSVDCTGNAPPLNLRGKVIVIGSEDTSDRWSVLDHRMWGFEIQARYIQALLSGSYLSALPDWVALAFFACFIFLIEGLPTLLEAYLPHLKHHRFLSHAFHRQRYLWVLFWTLGSFLLITLACLAFSYLPPLAAFGDIVLLVITRLLFFAAESSEKPLVHS